MEKEERIEIGELGKETLNEWYHERESIIPEEKRDDRKVETKIETEVDRPIVTELPKEDTIDPYSERKEQAKAKVKELLEVSEKKGLVYAVNVAKKSGDPFLLDLFHDVLAKDGNYKRILKK
ncbi:MAG: hypothetical protein WBK67_03300 [Minisyncoccales bacterium]|jgi:hypothetical protein